MRPLRLAVAAALLVGVAPLATASHARCVPQFATVCSTAYRTCTTVRDLGVVDLSCPMP